MSPPRNFLERAGARTRSRTACVKSKPRPATVPTAFRNGVAPLQAPGPAGRSEGNHAEYLTALEKYLCPFSAAISLPQRARREDIPASSEHLAEPAVRLTAGAALPVSRGAAEAEFPLPNDYCREGPFEESYPTLVGTVGRPAPTLVDRGW